MKRILLTTAALLALAAPPLLAADHGGHDTHAGHAAMAGVVHEEVIDGVKATFSVQTMADAMEGMGMEMPAGVKETHHISVSFRDVASGTAITEGTARIKIQNPDKSGKVKELQGMHGHFGADFDMSKKGNYGVMCRFQLKDGKVRQSKFWYRVK